MTTARATHRPLPTNVLVVAMKSPLCLAFDTSCCQGEGTVGSKAKAACMTLEGLTWIVVVNGLVQLAGFIVMIQNHREIVRMTRGVAGLVYQESEKTRARLDELFRRDPR